MNKFYKEKYDVIIIGASLSGLAAAITLLNKGYDVLVLEQHNLPGGVATSFVRNGIEIEASLHEMMSIGTDKFPLKIKRFFDENDIKIDWIRVPIAYRYISDKLDVVVHAGVDGEYDIPAKDIASVIDDPEGKIANKLEEFLKMCRRIYDGTNAASMTPMGKVEMLKKYPDFVKCIGYSFKEVIDSWHFPEEIVEVLSAYWIYLGSPIDDVPATLYCFLLADYLGHGSYIPRGCSHEMSLRMLERVEEKGAQVEFSQRVEKILVKDKKVEGVRLASGIEIKAPYVISGAYPNTVFSKMIEPLSEVPEEAIKFANGQELGVSCFSLVMVLDKDYQELGLTDYATFYSPKKLDTRKLFDSGRNFENWDYFTSICTNIAHSDASPKGTCIYSITYLPSSSSFKDVSLENYEDLKRQLVEHFLEKESQRLGINLKEHILEIVVETPVTISHYTGAYMGAIYGYRHSQKNNAIARHQMDAKEHYISGLAFAGAHQVVGDGMAPAITNGRKGAKEIIDEDLHRKESKK